MSATIKYVFLGVSCLLVGLAIGYNLSKGDARSTDIRWKYGNAELVIDLEKDLQSDESLLQKIFSKEFSAAGARGWLKTNEGVYAFDDPSLSEKLLELEYEDPASRSLRALRNSRRGPWSYQVQEVRVGIPGGGNPREGYANVCESGIFKDRKIEVFLPDRPDRKIIVTAGGRYRCPEKYTFPDLQLHPIDAAKLFGTVSFDKYQSAAAIVIAD